MSDNTDKEGSNGDFESVKELRIYQQMKEKVNFRWDAIARDLQIDVKPLPQQVRICIEINRFG